jgi:iron complex transport system ATP-binding protein
VCGGYGRETILRDITLRIERGEFVGILGPNGSGKTTMLKLMTRVLRPSGGTLLFEGADIAGLPLKTFSRRAAFVPQDAATPFPFTVHEMVLMGRTPHLNRLSSAKRQDHDAVDAAMALTDIDGLKNKHMGELSAGERQRVVLARALAQDPSVLLGDEPTSHLDIGHQMKVLGLMRELNRTQGTTVVLVLHDLNLAAQFCDRVFLFDGGRLVRTGTPRAALTKETIETVYKTPVVVDETPDGAPRIFPVVPTIDKDGVFAEQCRP